MSITVKYRRIEVSAGFAAQAFRWGSPESQRLLFRSRFAAYRAATRVSMGY